jgi:hypothetical protein
LSTQVEPRLAGGNAEAKGPISHTLQPFRDATTRPFIAAGGFKRDSAIKAVAGGKADAVAFGACCASVSPWAWLHIAAWHVLGSHVATWGMRMLIPALHTPTPTPTHLRTPPHTSKHNRPLLHQQPRPAQAHRPGRALQRV